MYAIRSYYAGTADWPRIDRITARWARQLGIGEEAVPTACRITSYNVCYTKLLRLAWQTPAIAFWHDWLARSLQESELPDAPSFADGQVSGILWEAELVRAVEQRVLTENSFVRQAVLAWQRLV